jgi:glyoxylase I family protein
MATIEHFAIYADDTTALTKFYVDTFNMTVVHKGSGENPGYFLADERGMMIEIIARPAATAVNQRWVCHLAFWVEDVWAKKRELEATGLTFETETEVNNDDLHTAFFNDPAGNRAQIVWRKKILGGS